MVILYFILMVVFVIASLIGGGVAVAEKNSHYHGSSDDIQYKYIAAGVTAGFIVAVLWPIVLPLVIIGFMGYGLYNLPAAVKAVLKARSSK